MLKDLFDEQRRHINHFFDAINIAQAKRVVDACLACRGLIIITGVGKSGIIAEKIAMTLISTGTKALYLPPTNFLHGDIGIVSSDDLFIMISKSGETEELIALLPFVHQRKAKLISLISNPQSRLAKESDLFVNLPVEKELCPFDLAPTTSTSVQLIFGEILAVALMKQKGFTIGQYALNHPSGAIGKKMTVRVEDLMIKGEQIPLCSPDALLCNVLEELTSKKCGCVLVVDQDKHLLGIFTDGDLRRALQHKGSQVMQEPMKNLMTSSPLSAAPELLAWEATKIMQKDPKRWIMMLPVLREGKVQGVIRMHDVIHAGVA